MNITNQPSFSFQKLNKVKEKEEDTAQNEINLKPVEEINPGELLKEKPDVNYNFEAAENPDLDEDLSHSVQDTEPKLMSEAEKEAFLKEIFANVDKTLENMWPSWGNL